MKRLDNPKEIIPLLRDVRHRMLDLAEARGDYGKETLAGWCILSSYVLFHILKRRGYQPEVCRNDAHAFILLDGWYIDVTATQFNSPWNKEEGVLYPPIYCKKTPAKNWVHAIVDKTGKANEIWGKLCRGWNQPVPLNDFMVQKMVHEF